MESYLVSIALKKLAQGMVKGIVTLVLSVKAVSLETQLGIRIDPVTFQTGCAAAVLGAIEYVHDYLKLKFPGVKFL